MTQHDGEDFLSPEEAAARLGVSRRTVERYAEDGSLKKYRRGLRILFSKADVERLYQEKNELREDDDQ